MFQSRKSCRKNDLFFSLKYCIFVLFYPKPDEEWLIVLMANMEKVSFSLFTHLENCQESIQYTVKIRRGRLHWEIERSAEELHPKQCKYKDEEEK